MSAAAPCLPSRRAAVPAWSRAGTLARPSLLDASRANHASAANREAKPLPLPPAPNEREVWRGPHRAYSQLAAAGVSHSSRRDYWFTVCTILQHHASGRESAFPCGPIRGRDYKVSGRVIAGFSGVVEQGFGVAQTMPISEAQVTTATSLLSAATQQSFFEAHLSTLRTTRSLLCLKALGLIPLHRALARSEYPKHTGIKSRHKRQSLDQVLVYIYAQ